MNYPQASVVRRGSTIFLQVVIVLVGVGALAFLLWEPQIEGRNVNATLFEIYFKDPFLAYAYLGSIPFFVLLHQAFKVLGYVRQNTIFSQASVKALRVMQYCAIATIGFVAVGMIFILLSSPDDRPPVIFMGILITLPLTVIAAAASMCEQILQNTFTERAKDCY